MFNLLIGLTDGQVGPDRLLEYTDEAIRGFLRPNGEFDPARVMGLPTLLMPELGDTRSEQIARVGHIESLTRAGRFYRFRFVPNPAMPEINTDRLATLAGELRVYDEFELRRTHWAVKDVDLYRVLQQSPLGSSAVPKAFRLPTHVAVDPDLVAVMMPFDPDFTSVYEALQQAAAEAGMQCLRADDMWLNEHIMDDIINLIWRARVIVSDLSSRNPNVFYETGIAHTLGRDVLLITQNMVDVPFDLRSIRAVSYLNNSEGRQQLQRTVTGRLQTLTSVAGSAH